MRLSGASTALATRTRTRVHTGAVKQERDTYSRARKTGRTGYGSAAVATQKRFADITVVELAPIASASVSRDSRQRSIVLGVADPIMQRVKACRWRRRQLLVPHRNRGYTLYRANSTALVARLRPTGQDDQVEALCGSPWKERWTTVGRFDRTILPLNPALRFIASVSENVSSSRRMPRGNGEQVG